MGKMTNILKAELNEKGFFPEKVTTYDRHFVATWMINARSVASHEMSERLANAGYNVISSRENWYGRPQFKIHFSKKGD